jgi:hypothetical protein
LTSTASHFPATYSSVVSLVTFSTTESAFKSSVNSISAGCSSGVQRSPVGARWRRVTAPDTPRSSHRSHLFGATSCALAAPSGVSDKLKAGDRRTPSISCIVPARSARRAAAWSSRCEQRTG